MERDILSIDEIAKMLSLHQRTVRRYLREGTLKGTKIGGEWRVRLSDVEAMLGDATVTQELGNVWNNQVIEYLQGESIGTKERFRVCSIMDCDFKSQAEASKVSSALLLIINTRQSCESEARFQYNFDSQTKKARFFLWGAPEFIAKCMEYIEQHLKEEGK